MTANPYRHPYFESPRDRQRADQRAEIAQFLRTADDMRARLSRTRVLPSLAGEVRP